MSVRKRLPKLLPADLYDFTQEDNDRFAEEAGRGMTSPQNPKLSTPAAAVPIADIGVPRTQAVVNRLFAAAGSQQQSTLSKKPRRMLVGLAAPQIDEHLRMFVVDIDIDPERKKPGRLVCFINPEIIWRSHETIEAREGCFSAGPVWGLVRRPVAVKVQAYSPEGELFEEIFEDFTARIVQHEYDHLDGIRFPDRIQNDRKRHWVHTEEILDYPEHIHEWHRICTKERWEAFKIGA
jgi:peptide deformylase